MEFGNTSLMCYKDRLATYENWSKQINPDKFRLAKAGFYYTGQSDVVTCFACDITISHWESSDDPWIEHYRWSNKWVFLKMTGYECSLDIINNSKSPPMFGTTTFGQQHKASDIPENCFIRRWSESNPKPAWLESKSETKGFTPPPFGSPSPLPFCSTTQTITQPRKSLF